MAQYITEVLKEINAAPDLLQTKYACRGNGGPLGIIFFHAFVPQGKFLLPEDTPPFKKSAEPLGMSVARFINETRKFYVFCRPDLRPFKREQMFIGLLESIHPEEAAILLAIKSQSLTKMYPNITPAAVTAGGYRITESSATRPAFQPAYRPTENVKPVARGRGRPRKNPLPE